MFSNLENKELDKFLIQRSDRTIGIVREEGGFTVIIYEECGIDDILGHFGKIEETIEAARDNAKYFKTIFDEDAEIIKAYYYDHP